MRRLWLLAVLVVPFVVIATTPPTPTAGQITFPTVNLTNEDKYINIEECGSAATTIHLSWSPTYVTTNGTTYSAANLRSYWLYAANQSSSGDCPPTSNTTSGLIANQVGTTGIITGADPQPDVEYSTSAIATAALGGVNCSSGAADQTIYLCAQAKNGTSVADTNIGAARGQLILSLTRPGPPVIGSAQPGDNAVNVDWSPTSGAADTVSYAVRATPSGGGSAVVSPRVTTQNYRLTGLANDVSYDVAVIAYSAASNPSDPSSAVSVTPSHVLDFYNEYRAAGGQEQGGCAGGAAGPVALIAAAAALVAVRRKRK